MMVLRMVSRRVMKNSFLVILCVIVFVSLLQHNDRPINPDESNTIQDPLSKVNERMAESVKIAQSMSEVAADNVLVSQKDETFELSLLEAIGTLHTEQMIASLKRPLVLEKPKEVKKIFLVASWRTGSSFLGELIHSFPGVFYSFEPLHFLEFHKPKSPMEPMELTRSIFNCQFTSDYLKHINRIGKGSQDYIQMNRRVKEACHHDSSLCSQPDFVRNLCLHFPIQLVKELRVSLSEIFEDGLFDSNDLEFTGEWKLVYLVRDPRAVMSSRSNLSWCKKNASCRNVTHLCQTMETDLTLLESLQAQHPDRYYLVKHEEFSSDVETGTKKLFEFLGLPITASVRVFLETHTKGTEEGKIETHSTHRFSKNVVNAWRDRLPKKKEAIINNACSSVLKTLNYPP